MGYTEPALLTSGTPAGLSILDAKATQIPGPNQIAAPPLDFLNAPSRFLDRLAPKALLIIETEIWPELFLQCFSRSIPVIMLSARLSERSRDRLSRFKSFISQTLSIPSLVAAITPQDRDRLIDLGLNPLLSAAIGSPKFDRLIVQAKATLSEFSQAGQLDLTDQTNWPKFTSIQTRSNKPLILAGSTHPGEEELILTAWRALCSPGADLAIAPRHLTRVPEILNLIDSFGAKPSLFSKTGSLKPPPESVTVVDQMGLLASLYRDCDLAIIGGSFFAGAGHNPLEPLAFGKPVIFGPNMSGFKSEVDDLESLGAASITPKPFLAESLEYYLNHPQAATLAGLTGLWYLSQKKIVAPILARLVLDFISEPAPLGLQKALDYLRSQAETSPGPSGSDPLGPGQPH
jgi:3-deoxy-D-manno-octulosonic-acid transferase